MSVANSKSPEGADKADVPEESQLPEESEEPAKKIIKVRSQAKPSLWKSQALTIAEVTKSIRELSSDIDLSLIHI